jgi:hypothetical protein
VVSKANSLYKDIVSLNPATSELVTFYNVQISSKQYMDVSILATDLNITRRVSFKAIINTVRPAPNPKSNVNSSTLAKSYSSS